tara:strand:- start:18078 stop:18932 length:855 start_codon:yes stop_codon:yes gene_type:complete
MTNKVKIIAEIGANHNGEMSLAKEMIEAAKESGADYAKFQSWKSETLIKGPWDDDSKPFFQFKNKRDFYNNAQLSDDDHFELIAHCNKVGIDFLTTCFDRGRVDFLTRLGMKDIKIASSDATSFGMIDDLCDNFERIIISTGMTKLKEVDDLVRHLNAKEKDYALLHCVSMYPTPLESISIPRLYAIRDAVGNSGDFGISDHSLGSMFPKVAVSLGATWIEKHFTTDKEIPGPDNFMSITPDELRDIRNFCNDFESLGHSVPAEVHDQELDLRELIKDRFGNNR